MTPLDIQPLLRDLGLRYPRIRPITGGWASWTFHVDDYILRIARTDEIGVCHRKEARLLPALSNAVDFEVPMPLRTGTYRGHEYMLYRKIHGRKMGAGDDTASLAAALRQLHDFDVSTAAALIECEASGRAWRRRYEQAWSWIETDVLPTLDRDLKETVRARFRDMLDRIDQIEPVFVHADLGMEHVIVDRATTKTRALIDFETATIGDAAIDFVGILCSLGHQETAKVIAAYGTAIQWDRLHFYWWMGSVHAIGYGVQNADRTIVSDGISGLRKRLRTVARVLRTRWCVPRVNPS